MKTEKIFPPPRESILAIVRFLFLFLLPLYLSASLPLLYAAFEEKIPAARPAALGGAFAAVAGDANSIFYNPAAPGLLTASNFSFSQTALFNIADLPYMTVAGAFPTKNLGTMGFAYSQFGPSIYKETEMILSHSFPLARRTALGYNIRNLSVEVKNFGSASALGIDLGAYTSLTSDLAAGFAVKNFNNPSLGSSTELLPQSYRLGLAYNTAPGVVFLLDASKDMLDEQLCYNVGAEVNASKNFVFRTGTKTNPAGFAFGFGVNFGIFRINYGMLTHPILDEQHFFTMALKFGADEEIASPDTPRRRAATRTTGRAAATRRTPAASRVEQYEQVKGLKIDPNKARVEDFREIPGVGALTAQRIIDHRNQGVTFSTPDDLMGVPRMTKRILERMRPYLVFDGGQSEPARPPAPTPERRVAPSRPAADEPPEPDEEETPPAPPPPAKTPSKVETPKPIVAPAVVAPPAVPTPAVVPAKPSAPAVPAVVAPPAIPAPVAPPAKPSAPEKPAAPVAPSAPPKPAVPFTDDMLDINSATAQELQVIGFTSTQARNITRYRAKEGNFSSTDDLLKVPGVDAKTLEKTKELIGVKP